MLKIVLWARKISKRRSFALPVTCQKTILRNKAFHYLSQYQILQSFSYMLLVARAFQVSFLVNWRKMNNINFRLMINLKLYFNKQQLSNECSSRRKICHKKTLIVFVFSVFFLSFFCSLLLLLSLFLLIISNKVQFGIPGVFIPKELPLR